MAPPRPKPLSFSSIKVGHLPPAPAADPTPAAEPAAKSKEATPAVPVKPAPAPTAAAAVNGELAAKPPATIAEPAVAPLAAHLEPNQVLTRIEAPKASGRAIYNLAVLASVLWAAGLAALAYAFAMQSGHLVLDPTLIAIVALIGLAPIGFIWAGAYALVQARALAAEARRAQRMTNELVGPTALAAAQAGAVVEAMRGQIATASDVAGQAHDHLSALRDALQRETERLTEATTQAARSAVSLVETLSQERGELNTLALTLDARASAVTDAINRQARMVAEASDLAETQLRESEAALAARAADLAAAAGEATDASRVAAGDLGRQIDRLETASSGVGDQMRALEDGLTQQRAALVTVAHALRAEQEDFSALAESRTAQLAEFIAGAQRDVTGLNEATTVGAQSLSDLIAEARAKFRELAAAAAAERDAFAQSAEGSLKGLSEAGGREREHLESALRSTIDALSAAAAEAREAADVHAEAARARVDLLNEAAFAAGQKADQVFEARLAEAKGLIEHSAKLVEEAGEKTAARLEGQIGAARQALDQLNGLIDDVTTRAARLPEETGARAGEIRAVIDQGLEQMLASARKAAEETQAIDAAFQERVRRNYEMLSEAVQLMGVVAQSGQGAAVLQRSSVGDRARARITAAQPSPEPAPARPAEPAPAALPPPDARAAAAEPPPSAPEPVRTPDARARLRLTPTATDDEFKAVFNQAAGQASGADDNGWTWKELLTTLDGDSAGEDAKLGAALFTEIEGMGIDPAALLPKARIEEISAAVQTGDATGAREVVRTLAPAAIRRIARRLLSDAAFRTRAQMLVRRYAEIVAEAVHRDKQGYQAAALLASSAGRAYLLLDAATGQPG
jgi:hypothetical protein